MGGISGGDEQAVDRMMTVIVRMMVVVRKVSSSVKVGEG